MLQSRRQGRPRSSRLVCCAPNRAADSNNRVPTPNSDFFFRDRNFVIFSFFFHRGRPPGGYHPMAKSGGDARGAQSDFEHPNSLRGGKIRVVVPIRVKVVSQSSGGRHNQSRATRAVPEALVWCAALEIAPRTRITKSRPPIPTFFFRDRNSDFSFFFTGDAPRWGGGRNLGPI